MKIFIGNLGHLLSIILYFVIFTKIVLLIMNWIGGNLGIGQKIISLINKIFKILKWLL